MKAKGWFLLEEVGIFPSYPDKEACKLEWRITAPPGVTGRGYPVLIEVDVPSHLLKPPPLQGEIKSES